VPRDSNPPNRIVAALAYDGLCTFEFGIAAEVFGLARPEIGDDWYRFIACSEASGLLRANGGISITAEAGLEQLSEAGTIVVPGWPTDEEPPSGPLVAALRRAHSSGARLVSICSGVFLLAAAGLLAGRRVTTHWRYADLLQRRYPGIRVDPDVLYIDEGDILTSAGSAAGLDLLLHLVRRDFGPLIANSVARRLVMPPHREGGQAQFVERPVPPRADGRLAPLLDEIRSSLDRRWTIAILASKAAMSERTFIRRFFDATGTTPAEWIIERRIEAARELLETESSELKTIAGTAGFGSVQSLRHHFRERMGVSPSSYRARFSRSSPAERQP
jgi:AraC family transcriptional activator FtrA